MASVGSKRSGLARSLKGLPDDESFEAVIASAEAAARAAPPQSLRDRLADYFRAGQNASDRELAALFGASVGSISVYRCQLKKLGIGVASPTGSRTAMAAKRNRRPSAATKAGRPSKRGGASLPSRGKGGKSSGGAGALAPSAARVNTGSLSLAEIDQVLIQNLETELGLIEERYPELARPVANIQQTVRLLLKLHRQ
jgi:hypothetical protein